MEVRNAFKDNVNGIPWMDQTTKMAVMEKVRSYCYMQYAVQSFGCSYILTCSITTLHILLPLHKVLESNGVNNVCALSREEKKLLNLRDKL